MSDMAEAFDALTDTDMWVSVVVIFGGFVGPHVPTEVNQYPEVYGLAVVAGGQFSPQYSAEISIGGGLYVADKAAQRVGLKSTIQGVGN